MWSSQALSESVVIRSIDLQFLEADWAVISASVSAHSTAVCLLPCLSVWQHNPHTTNYLADSQLLAVQTSWTEMVAFQNPVQSSICYDVFSKIFYLT